MAAVRVSIRWFGVRKSLSAQQKAQAADTFGAEEAYLSATKKLIDTQHPAFKAVTQVRNRAVQYWRGLSLPYPEAGLRLIRQDAIAPFSDRMRQFQEDLTEAVDALDRRYPQSGSDSSTSAAVRSWTGWWPMPKGSSAGSVPRTCGRTAGCGSSTTPWCWARTSV